MAKAHIDFYRMAQPDFLKVMNDNYYSIPGLRTLTRASDWRSLKPAPLSSRCFQDQLSGLKEIVRTVGDETMVITTIFNPFHDAEGLCGGRTSDMLREDPEAVSDGLSTIAESLERFARACMQAGADGVYFAAHGGGRYRHTEEEYDRYIRPHDIRVLRASKDEGGRFNVLHVCGRDLRLEQYSDYPVDAVNWAPYLGNAPLSEARQLFRGKAVMGGLAQDGPLLFGDRRAITEEVRSALGELGEEGSIVGAGCALVRPLDADRARWVRDALRLYSEDER